LFRNEKTFAVAEDSIAVNLRLQFNMVKSLDFSGEFLLKETFSFANLSAGFDGSGMDAAGESCTLCNKNE
jgi:hypothetical protein